MNHKKILSVVLLITVIDIATAAETLTPIANLKPSGFYFTANIGGATFQRTQFFSTSLIPATNTMNVVSSQVDSRNSMNFIWGAGLGWAFSPLIRIDFTYANVQLPLVTYDQTVASTATATTANTFFYGNSNIYLFNAYVDLLTLFGHDSSYLKPFIGVGGGFSTNQLQDTQTINNATPPVTTAPSSGTRTDFAYRLMMGFNFNVSRHFLLYTQYSYLMLGKFQTGDTFTSSAGTSGVFSNQPNFNIHSSTVNMGITYIF